MVDGIGFGEGPVWCPDATLVVTSVSHGALFRVWPEECRKEQLADTAAESIPRQIQPATL